MSKHSLQFAALLALCAIPMAAHAQVYKWVDANGHVQYGDQPPTGAKTEGVTVKNASGFSPNAGATPAPKVTNAPSASAKGNAEAEKANKEAAKKNCDSYTQNLAAATEADYIIVKDKDGKDKSVGGLDKQDKIDKLRKEKDKWCAAAAQ